jgi:hypothetical protein
MSSSNPRQPERGAVPQGAKPRSANPFRKLMSALLPHETKAAAEPPAEAKPVPPKSKAPPPVEVLHLPKGVGTELRRAVGPRKGLPPVQVAPSVSAEADAVATERQGSALPAAREIKSVMRKLKAAPVPPRVEQAATGKPLKSTKYSSKRTRPKRDFPVI